MEKKTYVYSYYMSPFCGIGLVLQKGKTPINQNTKLHDVNNI
jgi:hypothetical protein